MAKEYELVGGQPVKITPLEVDEAGTYEAPAGQAFNPVKVSGGGSSGGIYWVTLTYDDVGDAYTANKSYNDVVGAIASDQFPVFIAQRGGLCEMGTILFLEEEEEGYAVHLSFGSAGVLDGGSATATGNLEFEAQK